MCNCTQTFAKKLYLRNSSLKYNPPIYEHLNWSHKKANTKMINQLKSFLTRRTYLRVKMFLIRSVFSVKQYLVFLKIHPSQSPDVNQTCSVKMAFLEIWQNSQVNLAQVFSCEFCEISNNAFSTEHLRWLVLEMCRTYIHQGKLQSKLQLSGFY